MYLFYLSFYFYEIRLRECGPLSISHFILFGLRVALTVGDRMSQDDGKAGRPRGEVRGPDESPEGERGRIVRTNPEISFII